MPAVATFAGSFAKRTGTGTQAITGVGFQPVAILFFWTAQAATGMDGGNARVAMGISDGTNHRAVTHQSQDNSFAGGDTSRAWRNDACLVVTNLGETDDSIGVVDSLDSDGFTIDWTTAAGSAGVPINFWAIGGTAVNAFVGSFNASGSTGNQAITGVGFLPTALLFLDAGFTTSSTASTDGYGPQGLGFAASASLQAALSTNSIDSANPSDTYRYQRTDKCSVRLGAGASVLREAAFVSHDADGFTVNWTSASTGNVGFLALNGCGATVGSFNQPAATGTQDITTTDVAAKGILFASVGAEANSSQQAQNRLSVAAFDGTNQAGIWTGDEDNQGTTRTARWSDTTSLIRLIDTVAATGASSTVVAECAASAIVDQTVTVNWTTADATAREVIYFAIGEAATSSTVNDLSVTFKHGTLSVYEIINGPRTMSGAVDSASGTFRPTLGQNITARDTDLRRLFKGTLDNTSEYGWGGYGTVPTTTLLSAKDFNMLAERRYVTENFAAGTLKSRLQTIVANYLDDYGVTLDPSQATGPTLVAVEYTGTIKVSEVLRQWSLESGYIWEIDYDKVLRMYAVGTVTAPFNITTGDGNADGDIVVERRRPSNPATKIIVQAGTGDKLDITDTFTGDGVEDTFTLSYPFKYGRAFVDNNGTNEGFDAPPSPSVPGLEWVLDPVANTIQRVAGAPANGNVINVTYDALLPTIATADAGAAPEDLIEVVVKLPNAMTLTAAQAYADAELARRTSSPKMVTYQTYQFGVHPGQVQTFDVPERDLDGDYLITEVRTRNTTGNLLLRSVTAIEGDTFQGSWQDTFRLWAGA